MALSKYLAFDFGAESGRAIIGILDGGTFHIEEIHRFQNRQTKILGHLHWDVLALFEEIKTGLKLAVQKGHSDIESIGIDTWGVDFGFVGKNNALLGFPYCYRDVRTNGIMEKAFKKISRKELYGITGIQFMQFNSVFQLYSAKLSKDSALNCGGRLLFMPDLFNFLLTGVAKNEYTFATTSQLLNAGTKAYDRKIFSSLGLPKKLIMPIIMPGNVIGKLLPEICEETGLRNVDVVAVGCHDTASAIAAVPAQRKNWAYLSSGTWSLLGIETQKPIISEQSLKNNFTNEGGVFGTIRFLKNVMGLWLLQQTRKSFQQKGSACEYDELTKLALKSKEFVSILNPNDDSFLNPPDMPDAIQAFCRNTRQPVPQTQGEFARCILESLALKYKAVLENIIAVTGTSIEQLHVVGGGSKNELLNQFTADACGIPVIAGPVEATAIGNVLVQAIAKKKIESIKSGREIIAHSFPMKTFLPAKTEQWNDIFQKNKSLFI
jgi:rhamnulokinase